MPDGLPVRVSLFSFLFDFLLFYYLFCVYYYYFLRTGKNGVSTTALFVKFCEANQDKDFERRPIFAELLFF